jgi:hypothetical protein
VTTSTETAEVPPPPVVRLAITGGLMLQHLLRLPDGAELLHAAVETSCGAPVLVLHVEYPGAPAGADEVEPVYERDTILPDPVRLTGLQWRAGGRDLPLEHLEAPGTAYEGTLALTWGKAAVPGPLPCWPLTARDMETGQDITTITAMAVSWDPAALLRARVRMFTGEDGKPLYDGTPFLGADRMVRQGEFWFQVGEMRDIA